MILATGQKLELFINKVEVPLTFNNWEFLTLKEELASNFTIGKFNFSDTLGYLMRILPIRGFEPISLRVTTVAGKEYVYSFTLAEQGTTGSEVSKIDSHVFHMLSKGYGLLTAPSKSRSLGRMAGSEVVKKLVKEAGFFNVTCDVSGDKTNWIQPNLTNLEMITLITRETFPVGSESSDYTFWVNKDGEFYFRSMSKMFTETPSFSVTSRPQADTDIPLGVFSLINQAPFYLLQGGMGGGAYWYDEKDNTFHVDELDVKSHKFTDGARFLGIDLDTYTGRATNYTFDYGIKHKNTPEAEVKSRRDFFVNSCLHLTKFFEFTASGFYPQITIGKTVNVSMFNENGEPVKAYSGKWIIAGVDHTFTPRFPKTNVRLYRLGFNDEKGYVI